MKHYRNKEGPVARTELSSDGDKLLTNGLKKQDGDTDAQMIRLKAYFEKLESQKLEVLSFEENHRLLSSTQHSVIADAMEDVLAQPSLRRDRRFARRRSQLRRSLGCRLSCIGLVSSPSSFLPPAEDDWVWDREIDKMSLTPVKRHVSTGENRSMKKKNLLGERVLYLVIQSGLIDVKSFKEVLAKVSTMVYAWTVADYSEFVETIHWDYFLLFSEFLTMKANFCTKTQLYSRHPHGHYLTNGAYKDVFKVYSAVDNRLEAISVMDISALEDLGNEKIIRQEVAHSILLSHATTCGICPNFLRIYDVFVAHDRPRPDFWGNKTHRKPNELLATNTFARDGVDSENGDAEDLLVASQDGQNRLFQYIRMEFCDGGDLEHFIGLQPDKALPLATVALPFFFQMVYGLYCARERFNLRHRDIKLLNFFLKDIGCARLRKDPDSDVILLHYLLEDTCIALQLPVSFSYWVKLADFGAADSNPESLGTPVTIDQFTTLENTPIEFLLEGDAAEQSYAADTFSLGLCLLHLFTGNAPYEEILEGVRCPNELQKDLMFIWMKQKKAGFLVLKSVARGDDENTFCHTLYRFVVLFGLPKHNPSDRKGIDKVWKVLLKHLRPEEVALSQLQRRSRRKGGAHEVQVQAKVQFDHDQSLYSIATGSNKIIRHCREGLQTVPGAMDLLTQLVDFDPAKRPTLKQVMFHPMFSSFRSFSSANPAPPPDYVISYYKSQQSQNQVIQNV
ncbi:hypothetical protein PsorP6_004515 [Peronosclerospora sorghi]|uniref:Uncharacterized protein n=1 Tax=Peronosclerospora sorghi TaxID=230839 RepID=A0ACC0VKL3_9STRA|nr:hypothetical protein PsorP6_004515 [Peronosclerospora sorghi]